MPLVGSTFAWDPLIPVFLLSAFLIAGLGAGVAMFERFTEGSRRFFLLTLFIAVWMVPLGFAHAAPDRATVDFWLRVAYLWIPLTIPALYWLSAALGSSRPAVPPWLIWGIGGAFVTLDLSRPWLVDGLRSLFTQGTLAGWGWVGLVYVVFELIVIGLTGRHMARSRQGALASADTRERLLLLGTVVMGGVAMLDYGLARDPFRAGVLTPVAVLIAIAFLTAAAVWYRTFAPSHSVAPDEVFEAMSDAVLVCDGAGLIRGSNPASHTLLDRPEPWLSGRPIREVLGVRQGDQWVGWEPSGVEPRPGTMELRPRQGPPIEVSVSVEPIRFGTRPVGAVVVARDIRGRLHAERALKAAQLRYRALYHHHPAVVHEFGADGRLTGLNPAGRRILGLADDVPLEAIHWSDNVHPDDVDSLDRTFARVLEGASERYETRLVGGDGEVRVVRGVVVPVRDDDGIVGIFGVGLDVTDEERAKQELEVQRRYFADLFESSPEGIVLVEAETDRIRRVNAEFSRLFGYEPEEAEGRTLTELIVPDALVDEGGRLNEGARTGGVVRTETVRRRRDGSSVEVSVLARDLQIPGEPSQLYGIYRDISGRRATERALRQREEELRHAQKLEAVGKLAGGIAHDFNNLLTVINGHARFALENAEAACPISDDLVEIEKAGARAAALTQQLLAYSRRQVLRPQVLDPNAVVREVQGMLRRLIGEHIRVRTHLAEEPGQVRADRGQLEQVLVNLVVNARDAMPEGGTITLSTAAVELEPDDERLEGWDVDAGRYVRLRITDSGEGMDSATLERAFEPFFTTKELGKGTGLGLATVFGIVKQSGGHVELRSRPGEGTTCDVILPLVEERPSAPVDGGDRESTRRRGTVLVVEDETAVRRLAVRVLEREGCTALAAADGVEALEQIRDLDEPLDLVLSDLVMPRMGGRELAEELARVRPALPILFMSGYDEDLADGREANGGFLTKPFTPADLAEHVSHALAAASACTPSA